MGGKGAAGPTYEQVVQMDTNQQMWDYYKDNFKPLVDKQIQRNTDPDTLSVEKKKVTGQINADVMKNASAISTDNAVVNQKKMMGLSEAKSSATISGEAGVASRNIGERQNLAQIGQNRAAKAMIGLDDLAKMSSERAMKYAAEINNHNATVNNIIGSGIGAVAGVAASGTTKGMTQKSSWAPGGKALTYGSDEFNKLALKWG